MPHFFIAQGKETSRSRRFVICVAVFIASLPFASLPIHAEHGRDTSQALIHTARVYSSVPAYKIVEVIEPNKECWVEAVAQERYQSYDSRQNNVPVIAGGLIGGIIGHSAAHGSSNKKLGAVVGSVLGAAVGLGLADQESQGRRQHSRVEYREVEHCNVVQQVNTQRVFDGYDVTYEYLGNVYTSRMNRSPGNEMQIAVQITPIEP